MKMILSILIVISSILLGIYLGVWVMFIGGIVQIVNSINPLDGWGIAWGICRIVFSELAAIIPYLGFIIAAIINKD